MLLGLLLLLQQDSTYARVRTLLAARDLPAARDAAEHLVSTHLRDPEAHLLLGQVWYAWPVTGRYPALAQFRSAARLSPGDPVPLYWQVRVGAYLGSDEGEVIMREAILRIFAITPDYQDCWQLFLSLYHSPDIWRRADQALSRHPDDPLALERRAEIAIALEEPERAEALAARAMTERGPSVPLFLLRAEAAFDASRDGDGYAWYDSALAHADEDSTGALWSRVWMIASPSEAARQDSTAPGQRRAFFEWFWGRRDPDLVTPQNERIAEHFRRLAEVRRLFHLLHPFIAWHRSASGRALAASYARDAFMADVQNGSALDKYSGGQLLLPDVRDDNDTVGQWSVYARAGLSARGLVWLRHGRPDFWDREQGDTWTYYRPGGAFTIGFRGIPGPQGPHGDDIVAPPLNRRQARQVRTLLTTDETSLPATLTVHGWSAFFLDGASTYTALYVSAAPGTAAAELRDTLEEEIVARAAGTGPLRLVASPGVYHLALDVDSGSQNGRVREPVHLPVFSWERLGISSLVLAVGDSPGGREATLAAMPADLTYPFGRPLSGYAEVYGLSRDSDGRARYRVRYSFAPLRSVTTRLLRGAAPVVFEFDREREWRGGIPERLVIEPGRLPAGRYRVTLSVTDLPTNVKSEAVALDITIR